MIAGLPNPAQHWQSMKKLGEMAGQKLPLSLALVTSTLLAFAGIVMLFSLLFRFGPF